MPRKYAPLQQDGRKPGLNNAYWLALRTNVNGFYPNDWALIEGD
jgi:hypothetical protein